MIRLTPKAVAWALCIAAIAAPALADTLTLHVQVHASKLSPQLTGVHVSCAAFYDEARQKMFGPFATNSAVLPRKADGTADGTATVTIPNWVPEAKYWGCWLGNDRPGSFSSFYLPNDPFYSKSDQARRAASGVLESKGVVP